MQFQGIVQFFRSLLGSFEASVREGHSFWQL